MSHLDQDVSRFLATLPGVREASPLASSDVQPVLDAEERYERGAALPIGNLGIRHALGRSCRVVMLKDASFRGPPTATLLLVEEGRAGEGEELRIGEAVYRILGEELISGASPREAALALSDGFSLYPDRRTDPSRPSLFILPPVPFPELEAKLWSGRLANVVSSSPSPLGDVELRRICGFPDDPALATLVVGFDEAAAT